MLQRCASTTFSSSRSTSRRWIGVLCLCLVLTTLNFNGTSTTNQAMTTTIVVSSSAAAAATDTSNNSDNNNNIAPAMGEATINTSLHSLTFRIDPTRLQRDTANYSLWQILDHYARFPLTLGVHGNESLSMNAICSEAPGHGLEGQAGMHILNKLEIKGVVVTASKDDDQQQRLRLLCAVYTHPLMHHQARAAALTWGRHCDGFIAMSNQTIKALNFLDLKHAGSESYDNMWQKSRSIWKYLYDHYRNEYDLFHLGGDDMYVIPENLKRLYKQILETKTIVNGTPPLYIGQWIPHGNSIFVAGGGGYTINQSALRILVGQALPQCHVNSTASFEDRLITKCLRQAGVYPSDTRDPVTAEQTYHDIDPDNLYLTKEITPGHRGSFHARAAAYWETLPHPSNPNVTVGPRRGLEAASKNSVSFHHIHFPHYMVRFHAIIRRQCPVSTELGLGLYTIP